MDNLQRFITILTLLKNDGSTGLSAIATKTCKICRQKAVYFTDAAAEFEYSVSGICQACQDKYFRGANQ
jgi:hypothetical protein